LIFINFIIEGFLTIFCCIKNSGRPQGKLVVRHKALKSAPGPQNDQVGSASMDPPPPLPSYWHWKDLNVSSDVTIFGRCYRLIDCNSWTKYNFHFEKEFLTSAGIQVNAPEELPEPKQLPGAASLRAQSAPHRQPRDHPLKKFLQHDGQILRQVSRSIFKLNFNNISG